ncbi:hypothetical protein BH23ACT9_BH23ACT9_33960 [soil metagenome]
MGGDALQVVEAMGQPVELVICRLAARPTAWEGPRGMDAFGIHQQLIDDYSSYTRSFVDLRDDRLRDVVDEAVEQGLLWPDPWLQLNPSFQAGASAEDLVAEGVLHPECAKIFRIKSGRGDFGSSFAFHAHQDQAIRRARRGRNYVLTTGTGSGKSLAYIVPIVDHVLRARERDRRPGVKAIIVYPMNALANSQFGELEKFIQFGYGQGDEPLRYARYTGQENDAQREAILANPPDIVLTNYVMLELILTRRTERERLVRAAVAQVATRLFGAEVTPEDVIGETLARATPEPDVTDQAFADALTRRLQQDERPATTEVFLADPLSAWIESAFGLDRAPEGHLIRRHPRRVGGEDGAAAELADLAGIDQATCEVAIQQQLLTAYDLVEPPARPPFAFRLHQFLTKGDTVYATLEAPATRYLTVEPQTYQPGDRSKPLMPLAFCRECGQDYYSAWRTADGRVNPRDCRSLLRARRGRPPPSAGSSLRARPIADPSDDATTIWAAGIGGRVRRGPSGHWFARPRGGRLLTSRWRGVLGSVAFMEQAGPTAVFLATGVVAEVLISSDAVASHWVHDSALAGYTVAGLAGHLARAVLTVDRYLDGSDPVGEPTTPAGYFAAALASHDPTASAFHTSVRQRGEQEGSVGQAALVAQLRTSRLALSDRLAGLDASQRITVLDGVVMTVPDYLNTRLVELVVHLDDLAVSVGLDGPDDVPPEAYEIVASVLAQVAVHRAGPLVTIRSLARRERHPEAVRAF